ncbi:MAG: S8 family peptidase [Lachnospiraceae bacterium]|nr:S8 family peptidase [Lachnospiraceae bacterium]
MTCKERILSNDYSDILADFVLPVEYEFAIPADYCYHKLQNDWGILYIERSGLLSSRMERNTYSFMPKCYGLQSCDMQQIMAAQNRNLNTLSLAEAGILSVQREPLNLTGRNVTIGFIDTGIRYQEPVFRDLAGRSRIVGIWDQTIQTGTPPEGFEYGSEYTNEMINEALASDNPLSVVPSTDANGHGSVMASVAAGSSIENGRFIGAAPDCRIAVVKLKEAKPYLREYYKIPPGVPCYSEADILQAIQYLQKFVNILTTPLVICLGIGTSFGDHTGAGMLGNYINYISMKRSRAFVVAGGNEGNAAHHFYGEINDRQRYRDVELRVGPNEKGFIMDFWGDAPYFYNATIRSPGGESVRWNNPRSFVPQEFTFVYEKTRIVIEYQLIETMSGAEVIRFRFTEPTEGVWNIRIYSEGNTAGGRFDIWLPITEFLSSDTYFLEPNPQTTITEPGYVHGAVTVANYQFTNNSIAASSGRGFSRDDYVVPDIAAPGVNVSTPFGERSGSSVAAAITAGGCAQLMEWAVVQQNDILVNSVNIKNYLIRGAEREAYLDYPNREWGYGRLDISGIFEFMAGLGQNF